MILLIQKLNISKQDKEILHKIERLRDTSISDLVNNVYYDNRKLLNKIKSIGEEAGIALRDRSKLPFEYYGDILIKSDIILKLYGIPILSEKKTKERIALNPNFLSLNSNERLLRYYDRSLNTDGIYIDKDTNTIVFYQVKCFRNQYLYQSQREGKKMQAVSKKILKLFSVFGSEQELKQFNIQHYKIKSFIGSYEIVENNINVEYKKEIEYFGGKG